MSAILGGPNDNELHLPAQLLPLLIGTFGFLRICFLLFKEWRSRGSLEPTLLARPESEREEPQLQRPSARRSTAMRYLVAWLPWLSIIGYFRVSGEDEKEDGDPEYGRRERNGTAPEKAHSPIGQPQREDGRYIPFPDDGAASPWQIAAHEKNTA
jgi:hypothetical protein